MVYPFWRVILLPVYYVNIYIWRFSFSIRLHVVFINVSLYRFLGIYLCDIAPNNWICPTLRHDGQHNEKYTKTRWHTYIQKLMTIQVQGNIQQTNSQIQEIITYSINIFPDTVHFSPCDTGISVWYGGKKERTSHNLINERSTSKLTIKYVINTLLHGFCKLGVIWVFFWLIRVMIWQKPCNSILILIQNFKFNVYAPLISGLNVSNPTQKYYTYWMWLYILSYGQSLTLKNSISLILGWLFSGGVHSSNLKPQLLHLIMETWQYVWMNCDYNKDYKVQF